MSYSKFDRHENMTAETRNEVLDLIREVSLQDTENVFCTENSMHLQNMLYGLFDGYLHENVQLYALEMPTELASRIMKVYDTCKRYPELTNC